MKRSLGSPRDLPAGLLADLANVFEHDAAHVQAQGLPYSAHSEVTGTPRLKAIAVTLRQFVAEKREVARAERWSKAR